MFQFLVLVVVIPGRCRTVATSGTAVKVDWTDTSLLSVPSSLLAVQQHTTVLML